MNRRVGRLVAVLGFVLLGASACASLPTVVAGSPTPTEAPPPVASSSPVGTPGGGIGAPRNGLRAATLQMSAAAVYLTVKTAPLGDALYQITSDGGTAPTVKFTSPVVDVRSPSGSHRGPTHLNVALSQDVVWTLRLEGGTTREVVDARTGRVQSVALAAGANQVEVELGVPRGEVPVRFTGGANKIALRIPGGASASLRIHGAANSVSVDGRSQGHVKGGATFDVGADSPNRYRFDMLAGLNTLSLDQS